MSDNDAIKAGDISNYEFGEQVAPEGFNPDAQGFETLPPGKHKVRIGETPDDPDAYRIKENYEHKDKRIDGGGSWVGNQIQPRLVCVEGEHKGKGCMDFLPLPTPGKPMPKVLADKWANFIRAFGFKPPADRIVPAGFKLNDLLADGVVGVVEIEHRTYTKNDGTQADRNDPKYMGYSSVNAASAGGGGSGVQKKQADAPAPAEKSTDDLLDNL